MNLTNKTTTIGPYILQSQTRAGVAIRFKEKRKWLNLSWPEYFDRIQAVGQGLLSLGVTQNSMIGLMSSTRWEWSVCDMAILGCRATTVSIYNNLSDPDLQSILTQAPVEILFLENEYVWSQIQSLDFEKPSYKAVIFFDKPDTDELAAFVEQAAQDQKKSGSKIKTQFMSFDEFMKLSTDRQDEFEATVKKLKSSDRATILFTSGTSGSPKGVVLTHEQIISEVSESFPMMGVTADDVSLSFLPYAHILGRIEHWGHMYSGFTLAFAEGIERVKGNLLEIQPTILVAVPRVFEKVYLNIKTQIEKQALSRRVFEWAVRIGRIVSRKKQKRESLSPALFAQYKLAQKLALYKVKDALGGRIKFVISGGAPLSPEIGSFFHACDILLLEGYGLSETTAAICVNTPFDYHFGTVGKPIGEVQLKIAEDGEILVKSKKVMTEYYNNKAETDKVLQDGWFSTGDIGVILDSGHLKITDRKKDLIKTSGGKYVAPQKLENLLKLYPAISNVHVHGDQKKYIVALLTLEPSWLKNFFAQQLKMPAHELTDLDYQNTTVLEAIRKNISEVNSSLASFESIKRFSVLPHQFTIESGELTPSLKVKRKVVDQKYKPMIDSLYN